MTNRTYTVTLKYLEDRWDEGVASKLDEADLLRYRSNLLGSDLRITNFGGGNTSSKIDEMDPLTGKLLPVLWVKGSGGDLGSIKRNGFATLYLEKLLRLERLYQGVDFEDSMVDYYPLCTFGNNPVAASIDTPLHGFLPFTHVDHLHPDWGIALAASANGRDKMDQFNREFGHKLLWLPWQRPGFDLGMRMKDAVSKNSDCDGIVLGGHGLFTWGDSQRECYLNTISIIDQLGQFINAHTRKVSQAVFGGESYANREDRGEFAFQIMPFLRGRVSATQKMIGTFSDPPEVLRFVNSTDAEKLAYLGTSCPDHFIRTKIRPMYVQWDPKHSVDDLKRVILETLEQYRKEYSEYYSAHAAPDSPAMRDASPTVVLIPGVGMFSFGKNKPESRITGEFYINAIHVMEGATALGNGFSDGIVQQCGPLNSSQEFRSHANYVALPLSEAFRIEYWKLEEAKIRRQPPEKELSRRIALVIGGGSGIGREVVQLLADRGAQVIVADRDEHTGEESAAMAKAIAGKEAALFTSIDICSREAIRASLRATICQFGGLDILINTAAMFPSSPDGIASDAQWAATLNVNVTANYLLIDEAARIFREQDLEGSVVLTSSANAVVAKRGSEAYDVSKAALSHLIRELAISLAPKVRVNGISPATVLKGSAMFPRDRVIAALSKYNIPHDLRGTDQELRSLLADFYAKRTLTHEPIDPSDCAKAILFLAGPQSRCTSGHIIPVDGGLPEAFLR